MADAANEIEEGGLKRTLKDLFAGAAGGIAQVLLGELNVTSWLFISFSSPNPYQKVLLFHRSQRKTGVACSIRLSFNSSFPTSTTALKIPRFPHFTQTYSYLQPGQLTPRQANLST